MKFCRVSYSEWVQWFAWRPVKVMEKTGSLDYHYSWLTTVERKRYARPAVMMPEWVYRDVGSTYTNHIIQIQLYQDQEKHDE